VGAGEDRVERLRDRVGEDGAAADHRDAEHDRERGQNRADAAGQQPLERNPGHCPVTSWIASITSACDGRASDLAIWPSARKRTRSAIVAATASWVTITVVCPSSSTERRTSSRISALVRSEERRVGEGGRAGWRAF